MVALATDTQLIKDSYLGLMKQDISFCKHTEAAKVEARTKVVQA